MMRAHHVALTCLALLATQAGADEALDAKALYEARCGARAPLMQTGPAPIATACSAARRAASAGALRIRPLWRAHGSSGMK